jgi:hypothetical protein
MKTALLRRAPMLVVLLMAIAACTGLYFDKGNAYPCDFSLGPGARDQACVEGDACGSDNLCHAYIYEGPRFEGAAVIPDFAADGFERIHPKTLNEKVTFIASSPAGDLPALLVAMADGRVVTINSRGQLGNSFQVPPAISLEDVEDAVFTQLPFTRPNGTVEDIGGVAGVLNDRLVVAIDTRTNFAGFTPAQSDPIRALRATSYIEADGGTRGLELQGIDLNGVAGRVEFDIALVPKTYRLQFTPYPDPALPAAPLPRALDVGLLTRSPGRSVTTPIVLTERRLGMVGGEIFLKRGTGDFVSVADLQSIPSAMHFNLANTLMSIEARRMANPTSTVLSTWQIGFSSSMRQHDLTQAWPDCTPCARGRILSSTPAPPEQGLAVDVACVDADNELTLRRVTGSTAVVDTDLCTSEELDFPFDETRVSLNTQSEPIAASRQVGVALGGEKGELWFGETLSGLAPFGLERVPFDVFPLENSGTRTLGVLTDNYVAAFQANVPVPIGFRRIDVQEEFGATQELRFLASVHGVPGWGMLDNGLLVNFAVDEETGSNLTPGANLVTPAGDPIRSSAGGEAFMSDGGLVSFFVTGDDGLYFVSNPGKNDRELSPVLQPEPSVPIRSLALERTPLGTDGVNYARGYLVTSRNVFSWSFGGSPARWQAKPLTIASGEPIEVWFDTQRSALGRVGFSDGRIFTLPGGFQLADALPGSGGESVQLLDYENFGGWPVALASNGLFVAGWETDENGKLMNKYPDGTAMPMSWVELTMPDGTMPWARAQDDDGGTPYVDEGKLFVDAREVPVALPDGGVGREFHFDLYVFLPDQVIKLGSLERK